MQALGRLALDIPGCMSLSFRPRQDQSSRSLLKLKPTDHVLSVQRDTPRLLHNLLVTDLTLHWKHQSESRISRQVQRLRKQI